jgi:glycerol uptake facilitator protein
VPEYLAGEFAGAFIGAVLVFLSYAAHWRQTEDPGLKLAVFSTGPAIRNTVANVITEVVGTFILVFGVMALVGHFSEDVVGDAALTTAFSSSFVPLLVGLLVFAIGLSLGGPTGYAINPARDLSPRIAHAILPIPGKGTSDWGYAWIPVAAPIVGGVLGAVTYNALFAPGTGNLEVLSAIPFV